MAAKEQIRKSIQRAARNGKVGCRWLLRLAERTGTQPREIGQLCDQMGVRIANCQLGCFG